MQVLTPRNPYSTRFTIIGQAASIVALVLGLVSCSGGGGGGGGGVTPPPPGVTPSARFAYVANFGESTVSIYTVNATTGQLRHNGYVAAGSNPSSVTIAPSGKFAYVANYGSANISAYTINTTTGALTSIGAAALVDPNTGNQPTGGYQIAIDASGNAIAVWSQFDGTRSNIMANRYR